MQVGDWTFVRGAAGKCLSCGQKTVGRMIQGNFNHPCCPPCRDSGDFVAVFMEQFGKAFHDFISAPEEEPEMDGPWSLEWGQDVLKCEGILQVTVYKVPDEGYITYINNTEFPPPQGKYHISRRLARLRVIDEVQKRMARIATILQQARPEELDG